MQTNELLKSLKEVFAWNKCRLDCLSKMVLGLFSVRTVNLWELAGCFGSKVKQESSYKRIQRFF